MKKEKLGGQDGVMVFSGRGGKATKGKHQLPSISCKGDLLKDPSLGDEPGQGRNGKGGPTVSGPRRQEGA